jgi:predicted Zn-dependent protease
MTAQRRLVDTVLDIVGDRADAEVNADVGTSALTRFANSFIHQNVSEDTAEVSLRVAVDGRVSNSTTTTTSPEALVSFVDATLATAAQQPVDGDWPGFGGPVDQSDIEHWDEATAEADPMDRAEAVRAFVDAGDGLVAAGYCQTEVHGLAYGNTQGRRAEGRFTTAIVDGIHQTPTSAGSGHAAAVALGSIDAAAVGALAAQRARDSAVPFDVKPGEYEVVLSPECVATIAVFLDAYGFNAKVAQEGMSFAEPGESQFDSSIDVWDDATDPRALNVAFDVEGTPKRRVDLVRSGETVSLLHDRRTAAKAGVASTGHATPGGDVFGPFGANVFVGAGDQSVAGLIASVDRGIYVATFNYCRVLDPKSLVVTGLTRNGTFMIENGQITGAVTSMRFTQSFVTALGPGRVGGIGNDERFADSEFGPALVHAPSMHLASWNFTGGAEG